jgi:nicotinamidase-related amidase
MDALLVVDMQAGLLNGPAKHDLPGVLERISRLAASVRGRGGRVVWIQHCGRPGGDFEPDKPGWRLLPALRRDPADTVVRKTLNDAFAGTELAAVLHEIGPRRVLIAGWATDFCVDATVRSAVSRGHAVVVVGDAHTVSDREHLDAPSIIRHHNWVWSNLITDRSIRVASAAELIEALEHEPTSV